MYRRSMRSEQLLPTFNALDEVRWTKDVRGSTFASFTPYQCLDIELAAHIECCGKNAPFASEMRQVHCRNGIRILVLHSWSRLLSMKCSLVAPVDDIRLGWKTSGEDCLQESNTLAYGYV